MKLPRLLSLGSITLGVVAFGLSALMSLAHASNDEGFCNDFLDRDHEIAFEKGRRLVGPSRVNQAIYFQGATTPVEVWEPSWTVTQAYVSDLVQPLVHGTQTGYLASILGSGLGAGQPAQSWRPKRSYFGDPKKNDGWMAAYAFATRGDFSNFAVQSEAVTGRSIYQRFGDVSSFFKDKNFFLRWLLLKLLKSTALKYGKQRGPMQGSPMLLVFEGGNEVAVTYPYPERIAGEAFTSEIVDTRRLRVVMVPVREMAATEALLASHGLTDVRTVALEMFELSAIHEYRERQKTDQSARYWFSRTTTNQVGAFRDR